MSAVATNDLKVLMSLRRWKITGAMLVPERHILRETQLVTEKALIESWKAGQPGQWGKVVSRRQSLPADEERTGHSVTRPSHLESERGLER
jgi:hypothetical protein